MEIVELKCGDYLICDPCYVKRVTFGDDLRFDALRCVRVLFEGSDGEYDITIEGDNPGEYSLGVDSGRIWIMQAELDCKVEVDSGLSGHIVRSEDSLKSVDDVKMEGRFEGDWNV